MWRSGIALIEPLVEWLITSFVFHTGTKIGQQVPLSEHSESWCTSVHAWPTGATHFSPCPTRDLWALTPQLSRGAKKGLAEVPIAKAHFTT